MRLSDEILNAIQQRTKMCVIRITFGQQKKVGGKREKNRKKNTVCKMTKSSREKEEKTNNNLLFKSSEVTREGERRENIFLEKEKKNKYNNSLFAY